MCVQRPWRAPNRHCTLPEICEGPPGLTTPLLHLALSPVSSGGRGLCDIGGPFSCDRLVGTLLLAPHPRRLVPSACDFHVGWLVSAPLLEVGLCSSGRLLTGSASAAPPNPAAGPGGTPLARPCWAAGCGLLCGGLPPPACGSWARRRIRPGLELMVMLLPIWSGPWSPPCGVCPCTT